MTGGRTAVENILVEHQGAVVHLVIDRPPLNILDLDTIRELNLRLVAAFKEDGVRLVEIGRAHV